MMKRGKKETIALGLALSVLCSSVNAGAYNIAEVSDSKLRFGEKRVVDSEMIMTASTTIDISGKTASLGAHVACSLNVDSIDAELILQIYAESAWPKVTSWTYTENDCGLIMDREFSLNSSGKYRAKCVITAHDGSKKEKIEIYSGEKNYTHKP